MGAGAAEIAKIVPEIKPRLPDLEPAPALEPQQARFRLFDSIATFFKNASQSNSLMLVLEDLHWADRPSLLLLEFLAHEIAGSRILVIGTFRHAESEQRLSQTIGNLDDAQAHFEDALAFCRKAGYRPELAWSCYDYAAFRHSQRDVDGAVELANEALTLLSQLGMRPLIERAIILIEDAEAKRDASHIYADGLTSREFDVLQLIAAGKTNREIAAGLFLSLKTIDHHVSNILAKTSSANRAEAVAFGARHGLIS